METSSIFEEHGLKNTTDAHGDPSVVHEKTNEYTRGYIGEGVSFFTFGPGPFISTDYSTPAEYAQTVAEVFHDVVNDMKIMGLNTDFQAAQEIY